MIRLLTVLTLGIALLGTPCVGEELAAEGASGPERLARPTQLPLPFETTWVAAEHASVAGFCEATADCQYGPPTIWCTDTTSPYECTARDQNCAIGINGYVRCNGVTTWCDPCPLCIKEYESCSTDADCRPRPLPECAQCSCTGKPDWICICP